MNNLLTEQLVLDVVKEREWAGFGTEGRKPMIKVGDWVKYKSTGEIARVRVVDNDKYINGVSIDDCIKLPIKFKGFKVIPPVFENMDSIDEFRFVNRIKYHFTVGLFFERYYASWFCVKDFTCNKTAGFTTIEQAKNWLELQYATMLAKARGMV